MVIRYSVKAKEIKYIHGLLMFQYLMNLTQHKGWAMRWILVISDSCHVGRVDS